MNAKQKDALLELLYQAELSCQPSQDPEMARVIICARGALRAMGVTDDDLRKAGCDL